VPKGFRICRIGGADIIVDYSWPVFLFLVAYGVVKTFFPEPFSDEERRLYWMMGAAASALTFVSVLIHELAHSLVSIKRGVKIKSIQLFIFGGVAENDVEQKDGRDEFLIALAGPAVSLILGILLVFVYTLVFLSPIATIIRCAAVINLTLGLFNMIPGLPLDGGRVVRALLWDFTNDMPRATLVACRIGDIAAILLAVFGVVQMLIFKNYVSGIWCVCISPLMKWASVGTHQIAASIQNEPPPPILVKQLMKKDAVTVDWLVTVNQFIDEHLLKHLFTEFPVFNREELVGMVTMTEVKAVPVKLRNFKQIRDIMVPLEQVDGLRPEDDVHGAFERMMEADVDCMPVIEDGRLVGVFLRREVVNFFQTRTNLERSPD